MKKVLRLFVMIFILSILMSYAIGIVEVKYKEEIDECAKLYGLDENLIYAVIFTESKFNPLAESDKGAMGLMQITPDTALWCAGKLGDELLASEITVPEINIKVGCFYLDYLIKRYGGEETAALAAYNAGAGNVDEWLCNEKYSPDGKKIENTPFTETTDYIKKISLYKKIYAFLYGSKDKLNGKDN